MPSSRLSRASLATSAPLYDFAAPDGVQHTIWRTEPDVGNAIVLAFKDVAALYIAGAVAYEH